MRREIVEPIGFIEETKVFVLRGELRAKGLCREVDPGLLQHALPGIRRQGQPGLVFLLRGGRESGMTAGGGGNVQGMEDISTI